jgi:hypothetical protein
MSAWIPTVRRHLIADDTHPTYSHLDHLDGLPRTSPGRYRKRMLNELEHAWRNGEITYQEACEQAAELIGDP